jgi:CyaY protein
MNDTEFMQLADETLSRVARAVEATDLDADCSFKGDGVLEIDLDAHGKLIVNRHGAAREIWVAARAGGFHFRHEAGRWVDTRDGSELFAALGRLLSTQSGESVRLDHAG